MNDDEFVLLLGKAFLSELHAGNMDQAIAFGRAMLVMMERTGFDAPAPDQEDSRAANTLA